MCDPRACGQPRPEPVAQRLVDKLRGELIESIQKMHVLRTEFNSTLSDIEFLGARIEVEIAREEPK